MSGKSKSAQRAADRETLRKRDVIEVMSLPAGRRLLFDLLDRRCMLFSPSFTNDRGTTDYNEGKRAVGIEFARELQGLCSRLYVQMIEEQFNEQHKDRLIEDLDRPASPPDEAAGENDG